SLSHWSDMMPSVTKFKKIRHLNAQAWHIILLQTPFVQDNPLGVPAGTGPGATGDGRGLASAAMTCATVAATIVLMYTRGETIGRREHMIAP
ncbi:MAG: hypothetical protein ACKPKO_26685, partial [Candidatus Fonsibacter sp.]